MYYERPCLRFFWSSAACHSCDRVSGAHMAKRGASDAHLADEAPDPKRPRVLSAVATQGLVPERRLFPKDASASLCMILERVAMECGLWTAARRTVDLAALDYYGYAGACWISDTGLSARMWISPTGDFSMDALAAALDQQKHVLRWSIHAIQTSAWTDTGNGSCTVCVTAHRPLVIDRSPRAALQAEIIEGDFQFELPA